MSSESEPYGVVVHLAQADRSTLLALVSTLHRRGVEVVAAEFAPTHEAGPEFSARFLATPGRAATAVASLCNLVDVLDAELLRP